MKTRPRVPGILLVLLSLLRPMAALPQEPQISALSAVLIDARTGTLLYEKNGSLPHPPASLTKVVTIHLLLQEIAAGRLKPEDPVSPPPESWAANLPADSSLMFLGPDQTPRVGDLLRGLAVSSGNDAAVAAATLLSGSVDAFTRRMNAEMQRLGIENLEFVEPSGYDGRSRITARDFAAFIKLYLELHPQSPAELHSLREFTYPRKENLKPGNGSNPITQHNRNSLLQTYPGVDGVKTGYLHESGFNIALTAERDGMRLILVLLGAYGETPGAGIRSRDRDARALLDYGFATYTTLRVGYPAPETVRVWKGRTSAILPRGPDQVWVTVRRGEEGKLRGELSQRKFVTAPVAPGATLGTVLVHAGDRLVYQGALLAPDGVERGPWHRVLYHQILLFFRGLFGLPR